MAEQKQDATQRTTLRDALNFTTPFAACGHTIRYLYRYNFGLHNVDILGNIQLFIIAAVIYYIAFIFGLIQPDFIYVFGLCVAAYMVHFAYTQSQYNKKQARARHTGTSIFSLIPVIGKNDAVLSLLIEPAFVFAVGTALYHQFAITMGATYLIVGALVITAIYEIFSGANRNATIDETLDLARSSMQTNKVNEASQFIIGNTPDAVTEERKRIMALLRN